MKKLLRIMMTAMLLAFVGVASAQVSVDFEYDQYGGYHVLPYGIDPDYPWDYCSGYSGYGLMSGNAGVPNSTSTFTLTYNFPRSGIMYFSGKFDLGYGSGDECNFYVDNVRRFYATQNNQNWHQYRFDITAGTHTFKWEYVKDGSVDPPLDGFCIDNVYFIPNIKYVDFETGDFSQHTFNNTDDYPWVVSEFDGGYGMRSTNQGLPNTSSSIETTYNYEMPGFVHSWAWCRGESSGGTNYDKCRFYVDGSLVLEQGAEYNYQNYRFYVDAGSHTFKWEYTKDGSTNPEGDGFYVQEMNLGYPCINDVNLWGLSEPTWGTHPDFELGTFRDTYQISEVHWYKDKNGNLTELTSSSTFNDEEASYFAKIVLVPADSHYYFADPVRSVVNGRQDIIEEYGINGGNLILFTNDFYVSDPSPVIHNLYVSGFTAPVWGAHPDMTVNVPADAHYSLYLSRWICYNSATGDGTTMTASDVFNREDCSYYMDFFFEPESGYSFDPELTVYINGSTDLWDSEFGGVVSGGLYEAYTIDLFVAPTDVTEQTESLSLWPNPAGNTLHLEGVEGELVRVYDNIGRMVLEQRYEGQLDLNGLLPGIYAVTVAGRTTKFVKE